MPVTRPLWLAAPAGRAAAREDQEWMLGDDVLVAPVVVQGATTRAVRLPPRLLAARGSRRAAPRAAGDQRPGDRSTTLPWFARCGTRPF